MANERMPTVFLPHGAGPCFFMDWPPAGTWDRMAGWLRGLESMIGARPSALVVISAHWESAAVAVNMQAAPPLLFDYSGFPAHTYEIEWPAAGSPTLANRVRALLTSADITSVEEHARGLDHGVFIPLKLAFPQADLPVVQMSLRADLDPAAHVALGRALAPLRDEGVLIIGSGMSFHNMRRFQRGGGTVDPDSQRFDEWLVETVASPRAVREQRLIDWAQAPGGRESHPREEHLLPLHVVAGAAGDDVGIRALEDQIMGSVQSGFVFGRVDDRATEAA